MLRKEWPLVTNTLLSQLAAGLVIFLAADRAILWNIASPTAALQSTKAGLMWAGPILALAMLLSLFHLGNPFRAYRSVSNLGSSWLSREIFFSGLFFILWLAVFYLDYTGAANSILIWLSALAGVMTVISMASIYSATGKTGWVGFNTYLGFLGSIVIFGSTGAAAAVLNSGAADTTTADVLYRGILVTLVVLAVQFVALITSAPRMKPEQEQDSLDLLVSSSSLGESTARKYKIWTTTGWIMSLAGTALTWLAIQGGEPYLVILALVLVLIGEFLSRCGYFSLGFTGD